jgi:hypothetical protein
MQRRVSPDLGSNQQPNAALTSCHNLGHNFGHNVSHNFFCRNFCHNVSYNGAHQPCMRARTRGPPPKNLASGFAVAAFNVARQLCDKCNIYK